MKYDPGVHHRRSIRLRGFDYTQTSAYFITICTYERTCLFADPAIASVVQRAWLSILRRSKVMRSDEFITMPNHIHGIICITRTTAVGAQHADSPAQAPIRNARAWAEGHPNTVCAAPLHAGGGRTFRLLPGSLGAFIRAFKSATTKRINEVRGTPGAPVWQRNYYEHVVRNADDLARIRRYILANPAKWNEDPDNPKNVTPSPGRRGRRKPEKPA